MKKIFLSLFSALVFLICRAADPTATLYNATQCEGSLTPYPTNVSLATYPDTLQPVYISHVGRHGSRYPASATHTEKLRKALDRASQEGTITPLGSKLYTLTTHIIQASTNRWGALDSLGIAEQRSIAARMMNAYAPVFSNGATVYALSSYSPRSMMSMYCFVHQMDRMNNKLEFITSTGRQNSKLMRPFDTDMDYLAFTEEGLWKPAYNEYFDSHCPTSAIRRVLGENFSFADINEQRDLAITEYYVVAGLRAMEMPNVMTEFFTVDEMNALWSCFNLRQYLQRTATTVSTTPADIATELVLDIVTKIDGAIDGTNPASADLRFGHAETVMPLVSLLRLPGCYYLTNYFDTVAMHWRDFDVVPMAANVQFILLKNTKTGRFFLKTELNETPVTLIPGDSRIYLPWGEARRYMMTNVPLYAQ